MSKKQFHVCSGRSTGLLEIKMIACLEERNFPVKSIKFLASFRSDRKKTEFQGRAGGG